MYNEVPWRLLRSLSHKKERERAGLTVGEGPSVVLAALEAGVEVQAVVLSEDFAGSEKGIAIKESLSRYAWPCQLFVVPRQLFDKISDTETPQGALCVLTLPFRFLGGEPRRVWEHPLYVVGVDIQDPGNVAALIRSGAALGVTQVLIAGASADPFSPKVIRSSVGAIFAVAVTSEKEPMEILAHLCNSDVSLYKAVPKSGIAPWKCSFVGASGVVLGNESQGLREEVLALPGSDVTIPMPGGIESLNVGMACSIILYEAVKQRTRFCDI